MEDIFICLVYLFCNVCYIIYYLYIIYTLSTCEILSINRTVHTPHPPLPPPPRRLILFRPTLVGAVIRDRILGDPSSGTRQLLAQRFSHSFRDGFWRPCWGALWWCVMSFEFGPFYIDCAITNPVHLNTGEIAR